MDVLISVAVSVLVMAIGAIVARFPETMQSWLIRHYFGTEKPTSNIFYRMMITPSKLIENKIAGVAFVFAGLVLLCCSLLKIL